MANLNLTLFIILIFSTKAFSIAIQEGNQPEIFEDSFKMTLDSLPKSGVTTNIPWSDTYWPTFKGGISYRWYQADCGKNSENERRGYLIGKMPSKLSCLSPAEKFDLLMGDKKWTLTNYERRRTGIMKTIQGLSMR